MLSLYMLALRLDPRVFQNLSCLFLFVLGLGFRQVSNSGGVDEGSGFEIG